MTKNAIILLDCVHAQSTRRDRGKQRCPAPSGEPDAVGSV